MKGGLWNDSLTLDWLKDQMSGLTPNQRWVDIGLTDVLAGTYVDYLESDLEGTDSLENVLYANFAQAGIFPPVAYNNTEYFQGSTIWDLDVFSVVNECVAQGYSFENIVVDVLLTS